MGHFTAINLKSGLSRLSKEQSTNLVLSSNLTVTLMHVAGLKSRALLLGPGCRKQCKYKLACESNLNCSPSLC